MFYFLTVRLCFFVIFPEVATMGKGLRELLLDDVCQQPQQR